MGNAASCSPSIITSSLVVKVLVSSSTGNLKVYTKPVKAADLMLENPGQFICDSTSLVIGHRIMGLPADETLEPRRQLYFLLSMEMLYSVLTEDELSTITHRATRALRQYNNGYNHLKKIFPMCIFPSDGKENSRRRSADDDDQGRSEAVVERQYSRQRLWKPALETILEAS